MTASKAQIKATNKYNASNYDNLRIVIPKGQKQAVDAYAKQAGQSTNGLVNDLLRNALGLSEDEWKNPPRDPSDET